MEQIEAWIRDTKNKLSEIAKQSSRLVGMTYLQNYGLIEHYELEKKVRPFRYIQYAAESIDLKKLRELIEKGRQGR